MRKLQKHVSGKIKARERKLLVPERHTLKIARSTMKMHCAGARIMGGPNHLDAARIIERLTGSIVEIPSDCTCAQSRISERTII